MLEQQTIRDEKIKTFLFRDEEDHQEKPCIEDRTKKLHQHRFSCRNFLFFKFRFRWSSEQQSLHSLIINSNTSVIPLW